VSLNIYRRLSIMRETEKGYMSDDGVEFRSYIEC
jgi:hypothetical protein